MTHAHQTTFSQPDNFSPLFAPQPQKFVPLRLVMADDDQGCDVELPGSGWQPADSLALLVDEENEGNLGDAADTLVAEIDRYGSSLNLTDWLRITGIQWAEQRRPALAVAIEAAARLDARDVDIVISEVLADREAHPVVKRVAAHRARHVQFRPETQAKAWRGLRETLDTWLNDPDDGLQTAVPAIPSAVLGGADGAAWLLDVVERRSPEAAHAAALGLLDLLCGTTRARVVIDERERARIVHGALARSAGSAATSSALAGSLVWLLGAAATHATLRDVTNAIHQAFVRGSGDAPAGAIAAARLLVRGALTQETSKHFETIMPLETDESKRFWALVHRPLPSWRS